MKRILVNMNRSGYFWHELDSTALLSENSVLKMKREISEDSHPAVSAMRTYEQFNYLFMKGNGDYILSIRNLNDPRTDGSDRNLKQHVIFEDEDRELLLKLLAYYLSQPTEFERWITGECFLPGQNDALCKLVPFNQKIEQIKKATLNPVLKDCEFAVSSLKSAEWLQEKFEIKGVNVVEYLNKLDAMRGTDFLMLDKQQDSQDEGQHEKQEESVTVHEDEKDNHQQKGLDHLQEEDKQKKKENKQQKDSLLLRTENQQLKDELKATREKLKKWKLCAAILVAIAGVSIILLINALKN